MKNRIFWRVIGVGVVIGLISIGNGLRKINQLPSPSFSSEVYADEKPIESAPVPKARPPIYPDITLRLVPNHTIIYRGMDRSTSDEVEGILRAKALPSETHPVTECMEIYPDVTIRLAPSHTCIYRSMDKSTIDEVERILRTKVSPSETHPVTERTEILPPPDERTTPSPITAPKEEPTTNNPETNSQDPAEQFKDFIDKATNDAKAATSFDGKVFFDVAKAKSTTTFYTATATFAWENGHRLIYTYIYLEDKWWFKAAYGEVKDEKKKTRILPVGDDELRKFFSPQAIGKL